MLNVITSFKLIDDFPQKVKGVNQLKFEMPAAKGENPRPKSQMMK